MTWNAGNRNDLEPYNEIILESGMRPNALRTTAGNGNKMHSFLM